MSEDERRRLLQEETIVVEFEPARAKRSLPGLLRTAADRRVARTMLDSLASQFPLDERQRALVAELRAMLPPLRAARAATRHTSPVAQAPRNGRKRAAVTRTAARR